MNNGFYSFSKENYRTPVLINSTTSATSTLTVPAGWAKGDLLIVGASNRNGFMTPPTGWVKVCRQDALTDEWNELAVREANNEPSTYTFSFSGNCSFVFAVFRFSRYPSIREFGWRTSPESTPALAGWKNGIYIGMAFDAGTVTHTSSITGLKRVNSIANGNASLLMSYIETQENKTYGPYSISPGTISNDGYMGVIFS